MIIMNDDHEDKVRICGVYKKQITAKKDNNKKIVNQNSNDNNKINK